MTDNRRGPGPEALLSLLRVVGDAVAWLSTRLAAIALMGIVLICGTNVVGRYFFGAAISWGEEAMVFLMVFVVFASSAAATWHGLHMKLDVLLRRLPVVSRRLVVIATSVFSSGLLLSLAWSSFDVVSTLYRFNQRTDALELPMWIPQSFVFGGLVIIAIMILLRLAVTGADVLDEAPPREEIGR
jgi:C4-dicarboxylate transporter DctQ subunit